MESRLPLTIKNTLKTHIWWAFNQGNEHPLERKAELRLSIIARFRRKYYNKYVNHKTINMILVLVVLLLTIAVIVIACLRKYQYLS